MIYYGYNLMFEAYVAAQSPLAYQSYCSSLHQAFADAPSGKLLQ